MVEGGVVLGEGEGGALEDSMQGAEGRHASEYYLIR